MFRRLTSSIKLPNGVKPRFESLTAFLSAKKKHEQLLDTQRRRRFLDGAERDNLEQRLLRHGFSSHRLIPYIRDECYDMRDLH